MSRKFTDSEVATNVYGSMVIYHDTAVFALADGGKSAVVCTGGWSTATTIKRINQAFGAFGFDNWTAFRENRIAYLTNRVTGERIDIDDGKPVLIQK